MEKKQKLTELGKGLVSRTDVSILLEFVRNYIAINGNKIEVLELMTSLNLWLEDSLRLCGYLVDSGVAIVDKTAIILKDGYKNIDSNFVKDFQWLAKWDTVYLSKNQMPLNPTPKESALIKTFKTHAKGRPSNNDKIDQYYNTPETNLKRLRLLSREPLASQKSICFLGDDDLTSLMFALSGKFSQVTVFDIDKRIIDFINSKATELNIADKYRAQLYDYRTELRDPVRFDIFHSDPPATVEAIDLVLKRSKEFANKSATFYLSWPEFICDPDYLIGITDTYVKNGWLVTAKYPEFNEYNNECFFNYITEKDRETLKLFNLSDEFILKSPSLQRYCLTRLQLVADPEKTVGRWNDEIYLSNLHKLPSKKYLKS